MSAAPLNPGSMTLMRSLQGNNPDFNIKPDITVEEQHQDQLVITDHPVEQGATISDHAYKLPAEVIVTYGWSGGSLKNNPFSATFLNTIYAQLLAIQTNRQLVAVFTGRRIYKNMLLQSVTLTTDKYTENAAIFKLLFREVILVTAETISVPLDTTSLATPANSQPVANQGTQTLQPAPNFNMMQFLGLDK